LLNKSTNFFQTKKKVLLKKGVGRTQICITGEHVSRDGTTALISKVAIILVCILVGISDSAIHLSVR